MVEKAGVDGPPSHPQRRTHRLLCSLWCVYFRVARDQNVVEGVVDVATWRAIIFSAASVLATSTTTVLFCDRVQYTETRQRIFSSLATS